MSGPAQQVGLGVDQLLQAAAVVEPVQRQAFRQGQLGKPEIGDRLGSWAMKNGSNALPRKLACWPGVTLPSRSTWGKATNAGNRRVVGRLQPGHRAAVGGVKLLGVAEPDVVQRRGVAGQAVVGRRVVVLHRVMHRTHLGEPVEDRGEPGQVLGDRQGPAVPVAIGLNSPRMPSGASGFMSNVSICEGPPNWWRKMRCLARARDRRRASRRHRSQVGRFRPAIPADPARSKARRERAARVGSIMNRGMPGS